MSDFYQINKAFWNNRAKVHFDSAFYDNPSFLKGRNPLNEIELDLLGEDLSGIRALHLQCHFGQDTIALARMGAKSTGVDLSDVAISQAKSLAQQTKADADFICCNVLEIDQHLEGEYDLIFSSYGTIGWLPALDQWGALIGKFLKPGGRFVFAEFHPVVWMMDDDMTFFQYTYFNEKPYFEESQGSYASPDDKAVMSSYYWNHSLADVLSSLINAGLTISKFQEFDYSPYDCFSKGVKSKKGYQIKGLEGKLPMVFALEAVKMS